MRSEKKEIRLIDGLAVDLESCQEDATALRKMILQLGTKMKKPIPVIIGVLQRSLMLLEDIIARGDSGHG